MEHIKIIACSAVINQLMKYITSSGISCDIIHYGMHDTPQQLKNRIQDAVNTVPEDVSTIILGFGLCSCAVTGIYSRSARIVIPRVDDCIALFFGSAERYRKHVHDKPGTYYMTRGWIESRSGIISEYDRLLHKYGIIKAARMMKAVLKNYSRLVYIIAEQDSECRQKAHAIADSLGLEYSEIGGDNTLIIKMLNGQYDDDFIVAAPGRKIAFEDFVR